MQLFSDAEAIEVRAFALGERIDLRAMEIVEPLATTPLTVKAGQFGCAVLFRYGSVVLFNLEPIEEITFLNSLKPFVLESFGEADTEKCKITFNPDKPERVEGEFIRMKGESIEHLQVVAEILAKSVVLDHYEVQVAKVFERVESFAISIQDQRRKRPKDRELLRHIGGTLLIQQRMVGLVEIGEKPESLWDNSSLETFYVRLEEEYELRDRLRTLDRKLGLISRTAETGLELLQHDSSQRVEWYIVSLIVIEILLTLYQMFWS